MTNKIAFVVLALTAPVMWSAPAQAAECKSYVGQAVSPTAIQTAIAKMSKLTPRSEFESTAEFASRRGQALGGLGPLIISKRPDDGGKHFRYDADNQVMSVGSYAFDNANFCTECIWGYGQPLHDPKDRTSRHDNIDVVISESEVSSGSYVGMNAFGVSTKVWKRSRTVFVIYERPIEKFGDNVLFENEGPDQTLGKLPMSPTKAKALKNAFRLAFVVVPKEPYVAVGARGPSSPTINSPFEITTTTKVLFADIQCGLITGPDDVVLAAFRARD